MKTMEEIMKEVESGERKIFTKEEGRIEDEKYQRFMRANFYGYKKRGRK